MADKRIAKTISLQPMSSPFGVAFTADGKGLITCATHPVLWDLATEKPGAPLRPVQGTVPFG